MFTVTFLYENLSFKVQINKLYINEIYIFDFSLNKLRNKTCFVLEIFIYNVTDNKQI